jgi:hypothetical protein
MQPSASFHEVIFCAWGNRVCHMSFAFIDRAVAVAWRHRQRGRCIHPLKFPIGRVRPNCITHLRSTNISLYSMRFLRTGATFIEAIPLRYRVDLSHVPMEISFTSLHPRDSHYVGAVRLPLLRGLVLAGLPLYDRDNSFHRRAGTRSKSGPDRKNVYGRADCLWRSIWRLRRECLGPTNSRNRTWRLSQ